ncbi:PadR family transcriptional regulator [Patescibacteria group bacterium]|nr:PadR family transcriptional regulator [Patescibacteria group bacterium]
MSIRSSQQLDLEIMALLLHRPQHGYALLKKLGCHPSTLYFTLHKLETHHYLHSRLIPGLKTPLRRLYWIGHRGRAVLAGELPNYIRKARMRSDKLLSEYLEHRSHIRWLEGFRLARPTGSLRRETF